MRYDRPTKKNFKFIYMCYASALILIAAICLIHVYSVLSEYEKSQPERRVEEQLDILHKAAADGNISSVINTEKMSDDEIASITTAAAAEGLSYRLSKNSDGGEALVYTILNGNDRIADVTLRGKIGKTKLLLFSMTEWTVESVDAAVYEYDLILPKSVSVSVMGEILSGEPSGENLKYHVRASVGRDVIVSDALGNEFIYDGTSKLSVTEYLINIPSNYTIESPEGKAAPLSLAETSPIDDYKYVSQYTEMPMAASYRLGLIGEDPEFIIKDNLGNKTDYTLDGHTVTLTGQAAMPEISEDMYTSDEVLEHARLWSLYMTADLGGANYGFGTISKYLLPDSYLYDVAYKWATGIDITFTSVHTLDNPPFTGETVSNYVRYSGECFSCDVQLSKVMHLNTGTDVTDTMNSRIYYILQDGIWYICDIQEIIK